MFGLVPFASKNSLAKKEDAFGRLFDMFNEPFFDTELAPFSKWNGGSTASFKVDVKDKDFSYELTAELPGMKKEDISLRYENNYLTIEAHKDEEKEEKDEANNFIRRERYTGSVARSFYIDHINEAGVKAEFKDGILNIEMPKAADAGKPKEIEIH